MPDPLDSASLDLASDPELGPLLVACPDIAPLRFRDGELLVREGEDSQDLFIVRRGSLVVEKFFLTARTVPSPNRIAIRMRPASWARWPISARSTARPRCAPWAAARPCT